MMPHGRKDGIRFLRLSHLIMLVVVAMIATACGPFSEDEAEPTSTETTISQPTTDEATEAMTPDVSASEEPTDEPGTEAATPVESSPEDITPESVLDVQDGEDATPTAAPDEDDQATPVDAGTDDEATEPSEPEPTVAAFTGSDGTSGATPISLPRTGETVSTPVVGEGTPEGTPGLAVLEETRSGGTIDLSAIDPVSVDSCNPDNVPILIDGEASYVTNSSVNFRTGPGTDCDAIGNGPLGSGVPVQVTSAPVDREGDDHIWVQIRVNDIVGWVVMDSLDPA